MKHERTGSVVDQELYLIVSGVGYTKEELEDIIYKFNPNTSDGMRNALSSLQQYMNSSYDDAVEVFGLLTKRIGSRNGCANCERPDNLLSISSSIVSGFKRSIGEPSRKGAPAFATGNSGKLMNDFKNVLNNEKVSNKLQKTFGTKDQRNQAILREHNNKQAKIDRQNKVDQLRK